VASLLAVPEAQRRQAARARAELFPWSRTTDTMLALHRLTVPEMCGPRPGVDVPSDLGGLQADTQEGQGGQEVKAE
jgi:hypothetical protein